MPVLDLIGDDGGATMLTATGCVAAGATAATGTADWSVTYGRDRRLALVHGLANAGLWRAARLAHRATERPHRRADGCCRSQGSRLAATAAYLGGDLVFDRALMVNHTASLSGPGRVDRCCRRLRT